METCNDQGVAESQAGNRCHVRLSHAGPEFGTCLQDHVLLDEAGRSVRLGVTVISHARLVGVEDDTVYLQHTTNCEPVVIECTDQAVANLDSTPQPEFYWREGPVNFPGDCRAPRTAEGLYGNGLKLRSLSDPQLSMGHSLAGLVT
ncbi:MAG: hypothetical protein OXQ84_04910 [bacterium]|nr:hypothetical protein [bacterium]